MLLVELLLKPKKPKKPKKKVLRELYQEEESSIVTHAGNNYSVNKLLQLTQRFGLRKFKVDQLKWVLSGIELDPERVSKADPTAPILVTWWNGQLVVLDGAHRLHKAADTGETYIEGKMVYKDVLDKCKI